MRQQADNHRSTVQDVQTETHSHFLPALALAVRTGKFKYWVILYLSRFMWLSFLILPHELTIFRYVLIKFSGFLWTQAARLFSAAEWEPVASHVLFYRVRHGRSGWSWEYSFTPVCTTAGFVQKKNPWISYEEPIAVNRLLCPLHKSLIQPGYSFNKAFNSVEDAWLCVVVVVERRRTDWEGNTAWFVQQRAAAQNISLWFRVTKGKCFLLSSSALSVIGLLFLSWLTSECILLRIQCLENNTLNGLYLLTSEVSYNCSGTAATRW